MADNYLEKKMEEYKARPWSSSGSKSHKMATTLNKLLAKNRQYCIYDNIVVVREEHLRNISDVCSKIDFVGSIKQEDFVFEYIMLDEPLSESKFADNHPSVASVSKSFATTNSKALIAIRYMKECENLQRLYLNLGILMQSMLLRATEMGLNGHCIYLEEKKLLSDERLMAVLAFGKGVQEI